MRTPNLPHVERPALEPTLRIHKAPDEDSLPTTERTGLTTTPLPHQLSASFPQVRGYELIGVVGSGGMGIVYEARHKELNRRVAIKTLRGDALIDPEFRERFRAEAEAIAKLQHPNIIQVFEVGMVEPRAGERHGSPFIALEFVDGGSLSQRTRAPQAAQYAARTVETLARAAHAAHQLGIIHRDLKPANVLLTRDGVPKIADFGIAKQLDGQSPADRGLTRVGTVMGTPEYMAPEQLNGEPSSPAVDVYSLGVILYELLTARVPFQGATYSDTMVLAQHEEPVSPRRLQPTVPRDLETICLKCLEKHPAKRYGSAEELAEDLARFAEGRPIKARAVGTMEWTLRWSRRNPAVAMLSAAVLLVTLAGFAGVVWQWRDAQRNADASNVNATRARIAATEARDAAKKERWERYRASVQAASSALRLYDINAARRSLDGAPEEYRDWVWNLQRAQLDRSHVVLHDAYNGLDGGGATPDGRWLLVHGGGTVRAWDTVTRKEFQLASHEERAGQNAITDDGSLFAFGTPDFGIVVREVATNRIRFVLRGHTDEIDAVWFTPDGRHLVSTAADRTARTWEVATGKQVHFFQAPLEVARPVVVSPDRRYATARWDGAVSPRIWDMRTGREIVKLAEHDGQIRWVTFSPDGERVATVEMFPSNAIRIWEITTGKLLATLRGHENQVNHIQFNRDGTRLVSCSMDRTVRLWDVSPSPVSRESEAMFVLAGHTGWLHHVSFSPDGKRLVSASHDRTLRYWDAKSGRLLAVLYGHTAEVWRGYFRADGSVISSISADGTVRLWDVREVERDFAITGHQKFVYSVAFHPDGERVASAAWDGTARVWDATTGKQRLLLDHGKRVIVSSVAYRPNGKMLATLARDNSVRLWDAETGAMLHKWSIPSKDWRDSRLSFHPGGDLLACGGHDGRIRLWDVNTYAEVAVFGPHTDAIRDVSFSPDGKFLASGGEDSERLVRIWDVSTKQQVQALRGHGSRVYSLAWNRTSTLLASGSDDGTVRLWDTSSWQEVGRLKMGTNTYGLAFSPNDKLLVAACADNLIRVWDVETQQEVAELSGHDDYVHHVAFSPDGTRLVSASGDWTLRVWDALSPSERGKR